MTKMHENEFEINEHLVQALIQQQCPHWAYLPLKKVLSSGTDNALFRLGHDYVVRLPRVEWEPGSNEKSIDKEYEWIRKIATCFKTPISEPIFKGHSTEFYPWSWIVAKWNDGDNPAFEKHNEYQLLAKDLAYFLNDLHRISLANGPTSRRGVPLTSSDLDAETRQAISELEGEVDIASVTSLWERLICIPAWNKAPVWVHGDYLPGNIVVQNNRLAAVIDFSDLGIGVGCQKTAGFSQNHCPGNGSVF